MSTVNEKVAVGAFWSLLARIAIKSLTAISMILLARLLTPDDFGLIALTLAMLALFENFTRFNFDLNIIQKDEVTDTTLNSAWTCMALSGLVLGALLYLSSGFLGEFFEEQRLSGVLAVIAIIPVVNGLNNIGFVLYRKQLNLRMEFKLEVWAKLASFVVTVVSAFMLRNYWALVLGVFAHSITKLTLSFLMHPYRPSFGLGQARELFGFSKWLLLNNLLVFLSQKIADLMLGKLANATQLGYYSLGHEVSNLPTSELVFPLSRAIFPGYAQLKNDEQALRDSFVRLTTVVMFAAAPLCFGISATATEIVPVLLGDQWLPVIPILQILALYGLVRCAFMNTGSVFIAIGRPKIPAVLSLFRLLVAAPLLYVAIPSNAAVGAAYAVLISALVTLPVRYGFIYFLIKVKLLAIIEIFAFPLLAGASMYAMVMSVSQVAESEWGLTTGSVFVARSEDCCRCSVLRVGDVDLLLLLSGQQYRCACVAKTERHAAQAIPGAIPGAILGAISGASRYQLGCCGQVQRPPRVESSGDSCTDLLFAQSGSQCLVHKASFTLSCSR